jgi:hypothetical protein
MSQPPNPISQDGVTVTDDRQVGEVDASIRRAVIAQLPNADEPTERMKELNVKEMGCVQVTVGAQPVDQATILREADKDADDRRSVNDQHD